MLHLATKSHTLPDLCSINW